MAQRKIFKKDYKYKRKFINTCIMRIRHGNRSAETIRGYKTYIFKTMKNIVMKNICNFINLLNGSPCREIPSHDELISECYIIFDKCLEGYKITKTNNFYFYFNKAMSRKFYKLYCNEINMPMEELSTEMSVVLPSLSHNKHVDTMELLFYNLGFNRLERKICLSRLRGERSSEFLKKNKRVTQKQYSETLQKVKKLLLILQKQNKY